MQQLDNKYEKEPLPEPMKWRVMELLAAFTGVMSLPEWSEVPIVVQPKQVIDPVIDQLAHRRELNLRGLSVEDARRLADEARLVEAA